MDPIPLPILAEASWTLLGGIAVAALVWCAFALFARGLVGLNRRREEEQACERASQDDAISRELNAEDGTGNAEPAPPIPPLDKDARARIEQAVVEEEFRRRFGHHPGNY